MNSTPSTLLLTMWATALPPPPPTPTTLMLALGAIFSTSSKCAMSVSSYLVMCCCRYSCCQVLHRRRPVRFPLLKTRPVPVLQLVEERSRAAGGDHRAARVLDLAAHQQQAHAAGVHRVVDHFAKAGHVLRDAHAHRHLQHFLGQFDHAFHLRGAACEHHPGAHVLLETRAAQFGLHHLEDLFVAGLHRLDRKSTRLNSSH